MVQVQLEFASKMARDQPFLQFFMRLYHSLEGRKILSLHTFK